MGDLEKLTEQLNADDKEERLNALREMKEQIDQNLIAPVPRKNECNNHVHSKYSFSPYSPTKIAWQAYLAGLSTCGIVDHESVAGCEEFREACSVLKIAPTIGLEVRMHWDNTPLAGQKFNNPDQRSVGYFPTHGLPLSSLPALEEFLLPIRRAREARNRLMTAKVSDILKHFGMELDFERDVVPVSFWKQKGSITERHILFATAGMIMKNCGKGRLVLDFLEEKLGISVPESNRKYLADEENVIYQYDLTNVLKGFFSESMYVPAGHEETPDVRTAVPFLNGLGCISTYTYLGDVKKSSVTGDKKVQKFEDDILDQMFECLSEYGMRGFSYAPTRNSPDQIERVRRLCSRYQMLEICGEDINQPRQNFNCKYSSDQDRNFFNDSTWAIIGHEKLAQQNLNDSIISDATVSKFPDIRERIQYYKKAGMEK